MHPPTYEQEADRITDQVMAVESYFPPPEQAYLVGPVRVLGDIDAHLATANVPGAQDTWAVLSNQTVSLQTFALYGQRFGGIEPHFVEVGHAWFNRFRGVLIRWAKSAQSYLGFVQLAACLLVGRKLLLFSG